MQDMEDYTNDAFVRIVGDLQCNNQVKEDMSPCFTELWVNVEELSLKLKRYLLDNNLPFLLSKIECTRSGSLGYATFKYCSSLRTTYPFLSPVDRLTKEYVGDLPGTDNTGLSLPD